MPVYKSQLKWVVSFLIVFAFAFVGSRGLMSILNSRTPGAARLAAIAAPMAVHAHNSDHFREMNRLLGVDMPRKNPWTQDDALLLIELYERDLGVPPMPDEEYLALPREEQIPVGERMIINSQAWGLALEALRLDHPMHPEARNVLELSLLKMLEHESPDVRVRASTGVVYSMMVTDPAVRSLVEAMQSDPDPTVAANAARQLQHFDRLRTVRDRFGYAKDDAGCRNCP